MADITLYGLVAEPEGSASSEGIEPRRLKVWPMARRLVDNVRSNQEHRLATTSAIITSLHG